MEGCDVLIIINYNQSRPSYKAKRLRYAHNAHTKQMHISSHGSGLVPHAISVQTGPNCGSLATASTSSSSACSACGVRERGGVGGCGVGVGGWVVVVLSSSLSSG